ncbi:MAG: SO2930 family diheme c-type cytochrome [Deltaproteobacteria bacterium]
MQLRSSLAVPLLALVACGHGRGGPADGGSSPCVPGADGAYLAGPFHTLAEYCLVSIEDGGIRFDPSVVPYDLQTPLFSDGAVKVRGVYVPPGQQATYDDGGVFGFPVGTILLKSFGFADDLRKASPVVTWVETRLLIDTDAGWEGFTYVWDDAQAQATLNYAGEVRPTSWIDLDGGTVTTGYLVPSHNQCKECHDSYDAVTPIGPKARQLNKDFAYPDGVENEIAHWSRVGILAGAPDPSQAPQLAAAADPDGGTLDARARAYLEGNCAHCHSEGGYARTTGLYLWASESDPATYGVCKPPVAAGPASGGLRFDIVPGEPQSSIIVHRMAATAPDIAMPQIGRSIVDVAGLALVTDWIGALDGGCP